MAIFGDTLKGAVEQIIEKFGLAELLDRLADFCDQSPKFQNSSPDYSPLVADIEKICQAALKIEGGQNG